MEADKTFTFPFGETPEEVIRERLAYCVAAEALAEPADALANWFSNMPQWQFAGDPDNLLTVLDALKWRSMVYMDSDNPADVERNKNPEFSPSGALRISILAALGINEGGA